MIPARAVLRALLCSGLAALTTLALLQIGGGLVLGDAGREGVGGPSLSAEPRSAPGLIFGRVGLVMLSLLWTLALMWGALSTWALRRFREQSLLVYLGAGLVCGAALGGLGIGATRLSMRVTPPAGRVLVVLLSFSAGWMAGLAAYWSLKRREGRRASPR